MVQSTAHKHNSTRRATDQGVLDALAPPVSGARSRLIAAAEAARARGELDAAILYGSRARGDHDTESDWDVCLVGGASAETARKAIAEDTNFAIESIWIATDQQLREATEGTVWAHIVREGQILAGDPHLLDNITIGPMTTATVDLQLGLTIRRVHRVAKAAIGRANEREYARIWRHTEGTAESARATLGVIAVLAGFAGTKRTGPYHTIEGRRAAAQAEYELDNVEAQPVWERRVTTVLRRCTELFEGSLTGRGPLAALREPAEKHKLTPTLRGLASEAATMVETLLETHGEQARGTFWTTMRALGERCRRAAMGDHTRSDRGSEEKSGP